MATVCRTVELKDDQKGVVMYRYGLPGIIITILLVLLLLYLLGVL